MLTLLLNTCGLVLIFRYLITYFPRARTSTHPKKITLEKEQLAEIHGGTWEQLSVFQHIERGLQKNPDKPAVVCLFPQSAGLNALVATCVSQQGKLSNGYQDDTCTEPPKLWSKDRRQTAIANESDQESPQSPTSNESTEIFTLSYNELHRMALRLAAGLVLHGAQPNTTMLMLIPNGAEYAILLWVCALLRITYVNLDPAYLDISGFTALKGLLQTIKPQIVVTPDTIGGKVIDVAISELELPQPIRVCLSDSVTSPKWRSFATIVTGSKLNGDVDEDALVLAARHDRTPNRINSIMFTSGTSGLPKGCPQSVSAISYALHSQEWLIDPESGTANFALMQPHNSRGIAPAQTLQTWRAGGAVVLTGQTFSVAHAVKAIRQVGATFLVLTPPMVHEFAAELAARPQDVSSVKRIQIGGDAVTKDVLIKCATLFPLAQVCVNHGMTEGPGAFKWPFLEMPVEKIPSLGGQLCPVGVVAPGAKVRLSSTADGDNPNQPRSVVSRGELGELHISCPSLIKHYLGGRSEDSFYDDDGGRWFNTGDMGMMDNSGLVYIVGRRKDMIQCAGRTIAPAVIESCAAAFTQTQTIVVPAPHAVLGTEPFAVIENFANATAEQIKEHVRAVLGANNALGGVVALKQLGLVEFPFNATHKVVKTDVQAAVIKYLKSASLKSEKA